MILSYRLDFAYVLWSKRAQHGLALAVSMSGGRLFVLTAGFCASSLINSTILLTLLHLGLLA